MANKFKFTPDTPKTLGRELAKLSIEKLDELHSEEGLGSKPKFEEQFERKFGRKGLLIESLALHFNDSPEEWKDYKFFIENEAQIKRAARRLERRA